MTSRGFYTLLLGTLMLVTALSVGSQAAFLLGVCALSVWLLALLSVLLARLTCRWQESIGTGQVVRGEHCPYSLQIAMHTPLPVAPLTLSLSLPAGRKADYLLTTRLFGKTETQNRFSCPHVGLFSVGLAEIMLSDCFDLFHLRIDVKDAPKQLTVLPNPRHCAPIAFSPGEDEMTSMSRSLSDLSTPSDIRAWQDGDELKRVHWKLSMRRQSLMVHTYETPERPDALLLVDCSVPPVPPERRAAMIDALTESCAGAIRSLLMENRPVLLPLRAVGARELRGQGIASLEPLTFALAQESFDSQSNFAAFLLESSKRLRRTGSTVIFSCSLTPVLADAAISLSRLGPKTRYVYVCPGKPDELCQKLIALLHASGVETEVVNA